MKRALVAMVALIVLTGADGGAAGGSTLDVIALLREFGFPIFVSVWFMWRLEKRLDRFTESIEKLYTVVTVMAKTIDELDRVAPHVPTPPPPPPMRIVPEPSR